jgi:hypothetical protein
MRAMNRQCYRRVDSDSNGLDKKLTTPSSLMPRFRRRIVAPQPSAPTGSRSDYPSAVPEPAPIETALVQTERWFVTRGLPHFVERRDTVWTIWSRAVPLLVVAYVLLGLNALDLHSWSWQRNVLAAAFVLAVLVVIWMGSNRLRGLPLLERPREVGPVELALLVLVPAIPSAVFGQWGDAFQTLVEGVAVVAVVWAITSYGVAGLLGWAAKRTRSQITVFLNVIARALPLLLLFQTFLFINAEVWQVAGTLAGPVYWLALSTFFVMGNVFLLSRVPTLVRSLNTFEDWDEVRGLADPEVATDLLPWARLDSAGPPIDRPTVRQRFNIGLVALFSQAIQITAAALAMFGFFVLFGFLAIPVETASAWTTIVDVNTFATWRVGGRALALTEPLLRVAGFLGAFTGMYFTVVLSTDSTYRDEFAEDLGPELRSAFAVRALYRRALTEADPPARAGRAE